MLRELDKQERFKHVMITKLDELVEYGILKDVRAKGGYRDYTLLHLDALNLLLGQRHDK